MNAHSPAYESSAASASSGTYGSHLRPHIVTPAAQTNGRVGQSQKQGRKQKLPTKACSMVPIVTPVQRMTRDSSSSIRTSPLMVRFGFGFVVITPSFSEAVISLSPLIFVDFSSVNLRMWSPHEVALQIRTKHFVPYEIIPIWLVQYIRWHHSWLVQLVFSWIRLGGAQILKSRVIVLFLSGGTDLPELTFQAKCENRQH